MREIDRLVLTAARDLAPDAYGVTIHQRILDHDRRNLSYGRIYAAIDRLTDAGLVTTWRGGATPERGNRPKLYVELTDAGRAALDDHKQHGGE